MNAKDLDFFPEMTVIWIIIYTFAADNKTKKYAAIDKIRLSNGLDKG